MAVHHARQLAVSCLRRVFRNKMTALQLLPLLVNLQWTQGHAAASYKLECVCPSRQLDPTSCASLRKYSLPFSLKLAATPPGRSAFAYSSLQTTVFAYCLFGCVSLSAQRASYLGGLHMQSTSWSQSPVMFILYVRAAGAAARLEVPHKA